MTAIRKILIPEFGDYTKIKVVEQNLQEPQANHVQIQIEYAGFSGADINMRTGSYPMQRQAPLTPGYCAVGTVHKNGSGCKRFAVGDRVGILSIYDAQATYANFPEKYLVLIPEDIESKHACALVLDWNTAYAMVYDTARVSRGQKVFIHGMSGAVGNALLSLCLLQGAEVYGTASARNHDALRSLGAHPLVYTDKEWISEMQRLGGVDAVFDPLGFESFDESYSILKPSSSILVGYGGNKDTYSGGPRRSVWYYVAKLILRGFLRPFTGKNTSFYYISRDDKSFVTNLEKLFGLVQQGKISPGIKQVFPLDEVYVAHRDWTKLPGMGSVVVKTA